MKTYLVITVLLLSVWCGAFDGRVLSSADGSEISGVLASDTTLDVNSSPWYVTDDLVVPNGLTLTIEPGVTVYVGAGKRITVNGRLVADGTEGELIHLTRVPDAGKWHSLQFVGSTEDNRVTYAVVEHGRTNNGMIGLTNSNLLLEDVTLANTDLRRIRTANSSLIVRNCVFTDMFAPGQPPTTNNLNEHIWGSGVPEAGHFIIEGNLFGTTPGHNDAIDFDSPRRANAIMLIVNNVFMGGGDDALDVEADLHIEGNIFMNYRRDEYNTATGESNAISAGGSVETQERDYTVVHNIFSNVQHVAQVKDEAFMTFANNTVVGVSGPAIYFNWQGRRPGRGAYVDSSIFWESAVAFDEVDETTELAVHYSIVSSEWHGYGQGNLDVDPCFAEPGYWDANNTPDDANDDFWVGGDYHLKSQAGRWDPNSESWVQDDVNSPCIDAGDPNSNWPAELWPHGKRINMGAFSGTPQASMSLSNEGNVADLNNDDSVDYNDLKLFTDKWLYEAVLLPEVLNRDGIVNFTDFSIFANNWLWQE